MTWVLKFEDDFLGPTLDSNKWQANWLGNPGAITTPPNSSELAAIDPAQTTFDGTPDGHLRFTAINSPVTVGGKTFQYRTGLIQSNNKFEFIYGNVKCRMLMPGTANAIPWNWAAFWLNGDHPSGTWPSKGENDVMENLSGGPSIHYHFGSPDINKSLSIPTPLYPWSNYWHEFQCIWDPTGVDYYVDNVKIGRITVADPNPKYIVLNYAIATAHGGPLKVPMSCYVDYVRVYQDE